MSVLSVGFVPSAPLLVPDVAGGSAHIDAALRASSVGVVDAVLALEPQRVLVVAAAATDAPVDADSTWDFAGFGVVRGDGDRRPRLPWSLGVGAWLLDECGWQGPRSWVGLAPTGTAATTRRYAERNDDGVAVLVVGDGSACRTEKAPGHFDPRAEAFDAAIAGCLDRGDHSALAATDPELAGELMCAGLPPWRWLSGLIGFQGLTVTSAELVSHTAPYGVGYFVATWLLA